VRNTLSSIDAKNSEISKKLDIRPLRKDEVEEAEKLVRLAFGTFFNVPDPTANPLERRMIAHRFKQNPRKVIAAAYNQELVGTNVLTEWGSYGFFGPLTVRPDLWNSGIGGRLVAEAVDQFTQDGKSAQGLFTFADSPKHLGLYHKFGYCSQFLTTILEKKIETSSSQNYEKFSDLGKGEKIGVMGKIRDLTDQLYSGLDLSQEIQLVDDNKMGDTLFVFDESKNLAAFAICQSGAGTEAGAGRCYVKFGASRVGSEASKIFERLLAASESFAFEKNAQVLEAGMNLSHDRAFDVMLASNFRISFIGVLMQKPNEPLYSRKDTFVIDDLR